MASGEKLWIIAVPMRLASDYIHPTPRGGRCRIRVYLPDEERDAPVVVCTELPTNEGSSRSPTPPSGSAPSSLNPSYLVISQT